ncbi:Basic blue protein [Linum grandiflorum]
MLMMAMAVQGRGSAVMLMLMLVMVVLTMGGYQQAGAATTTLVGGSGGWTFNVAGWPKGKAFKAGDSLLFKYDPTLHNVVAVNRGGYSSCRTPAGSKVYKTGKDLIQLKKGLNFFICNFPGHCESGMKIAINAT